MEPSPSLAERVSGTLRVNGREVRFESWADASLLDVLRRTLGLTGAKRGCDIGTCGTCTVLVDGKALKSCSFPLQKALAEQPEVTTIEALGGEQALHPLQQAFVDHAAVQCGYCTPGLVLSAAALVRRKPEPDVEDVARILRSQLCRCTGYQQIVDAILDGAGRIRGEAPRIRHDDEPSGIGASWVRTDATDKVTGACRYTADQDLPGLLHAVVVRSDRPHAEVRGVDATAALALPGVLRVLTHEDVPGEKHYGNAIPDMPALAVDRVRFVGDAVAIVVAEDPVVARRAAARVAVDYRDLPPVLDPRKAMTPEAPQLHPGGNVASHQKLRKGDADAALAEADVVVRGHYRTPFQEHACLEAESAIALVDGEELVVLAPSQNVYFDRREVARVTGWDKARVAIRQQPMGAAFGKREDLYCQHHAAIASIALGGRPVKVTMSREETFLCTTKRHPFVMDYTIGATRDGRIVGLKAELVADTGAYASWAPNILRKALVHGAGAYAIDHVGIEAWSVYTNNGYSGAFRGFGAPQVFFAVESIVDELADALGIEPIELRRRNMLRLGSRTATGQELHASVGLPECVEAVAARMRRDVPRGEGRWRRGVGFAQTFYGIGYGNGIPDIGSAILELLPDGRVRLRISTVDYGQGSSTLFPQIVCQELGLLREQVDLVSGDSALCPDSGSTVASRQTYVSGNAVLLATERLKRNLRRAAAPLLDVEEEAVTIHGGSVHAEGRSLSFAALYEASGDQKTQARFRASTSRLDGETGQGDAYWPYAFGAQGVEVLVDTETGRVKVERIVAAQDVGRALNPQMVQGQIRGAVAMGVGFALLEEYRVEGGIPIDRNFDTYKLPMYADLGDLEVVVVEEPEPTGPYGAKGVGEPPMTPTAPAIANAVADALGVRIRSLPITKEKVLEAWRARPTR